MAKEAGTVTFTHFLNSGKPLSITVDGISVVMLFWNGNYWEHETALLSAVDMDKYFRTEVDSEEKLTKAGDAGDASWLETRWDETTFDGKKEAVSRRQMKLGKSAIGVTTDGRAYVEKEGNCKILLTVENLADYAKKDLSNISDTALRDKIHAQEDWVVEYKIDDDHSVSFDADQDAGQMVGSTAEDVDKALIAMGFPYNSEANRPVAAHLVDRLYGFAGGTRLMGSAAAELCYVAAGRFDARIEAFLGPWDVAAGALILLQAGGKISDFNGGENWASGEQVVASNGKVHSLVLSLLP